MLEDGLAYIDLLTSPHATLLNVLSFGHAVASECQKILEDHVFSKLKVGQNGRGRGHISDNKKLS